MEAEFFFMGHFFWSIYNEIIVHNVKDNGHFQIIPKTEKRPKWRYKVLLQQQQYAVLISHSHVSALYVVLCNVLLLCVAPCATHHWCFSIPALKNTHSFYHVF